MIFDSGHQHKRIDGEKKKSWKQVEKKIIRNIFNNVIVSVDIFIFRVEKGNFVQFLLNGGHKKCKVVLLARICLRFFSLSISLSRHAADVLF